MRSIRQIRAVVRSAQANVRLLLRFLSEMRAVPAARRTKPLRDLPAWMRSQRRGSPLEDGRPWITFAAVREMEELLPRVERAFEYGSGGSTVFLCQRVKELVSIEHDPDWAETVRRRIDAIGCSATLEIRPPTIDPSDELYRSTDSRYVGRSFRGYASSIDSYPDGYFDLVLIDGRARVACFGHAARKIRPGGWLILDNSDLDEYQAVNEVGRLRGWTAREIDGPGPYSAAFWRTTIWTTPDPSAAR